MFVTSCDGRLSSGKPKRCHILNFPSKRNESSFQESHKQGEIMVAVFTTRQSLEVMMKPQVTPVSCHLARRGTTNGYTRWATSSDTSSSSETPRDQDENDDCEEGEHVSLLLVSQCACEEQEEEEENSAMCRSQRRFCKKDEESYATALILRIARGLWNLPLLPQGPWKITKDQVLLDEKGVKLCKFFMVSVCSILGVHFYGILMNADRDESYGLREIVLYDGNHIALDIIVFFVIGRLYEDKSLAVDTLGWIVPSIGSAVALSWVASTSNSLHHSITAYEIHCTWTWQFWLLIACGALPTIIILIVAHLVHAARQKAVFQKQLELVLGFSIFLLPYCTNSFFHLHHWYYAWVLGMHANANTWWSRLTMSILWGIYLNGIALFGRDPVMTCAVTLYQSQNQQCPFLVDPDFTLQTLEVSSVDLDWRNCS